MFELNRCAVATVDEEQRSKDEGRHPAKTTQNSLCETPILTTTESVWFWQKDGTRDGSREIGYICWLLFYAVVYNVHAAIADKYCKGAAIP